MIYLDNAATTAVSTRLKYLIDNYSYYEYGNAGSLHKLGIRSRQAIENAREKIAECIKTEPENIIFTSSGSEANTLAILGLANHLRSAGKTHIITTKYEHHSVLNAMKKMESQGFEVTYLDVNAGVVDYEDFVNAIRPDTGLASVMYVNNEIGTINSIQEIYDICKGKGILFHSDCVQAVGTEHIDMESVGDMISVSGHKIHAPKGIGFLCTKHRNLLTNVICGGKQEFGIRPGTENVAAIAALGEAFEFCTQNLGRDIEKLQHLSSVFKRMLSEFCSRENIFLQYTLPYAETSPKIISCRFDGIEAETFLQILSDQGVCVSAGAACSSVSVEPSHVLKAVGLTDEQARSTVRVSFSAYNTENEVKRAAEIIARCASNLKRMGESLDE